MKTKPIKSLDKGIKKYVEILRSEGIETYESCEGGAGHAYFEPTICFYGQIGEGFIGSIKSSKS